MTLAPVPITQNNLKEKLGFPCRDHVFSIPFVLSRVSIRAATVFFQRVKHQIKELSVLVLWAEGLWLCQLRLISLFFSYSTRILFTVFSRLHNYIWTKRLVPWERWSNNDFAFTCKLNFSSTQGCKWGFPYGNNIFLPQEFTISSRQQYFVQL